MNEENVEANNAVSSSSKLAEGLGAGLIAKGLEYPSPDTKPVNELTKGLGAGLVPVRKLEDSIAEFTKGLSDPKLQKLTDGITSKSTFLPEAMEAVKKLHGSELGKRAFDHAKHEVKEAVFIPEYCRPSRNISMETLADSIAEVSAKLDRLLEAQGL